MASPMSFIRRNQKWLMAVFGILLMVVFLITMILPQGFSNSGGGPRENPVVVRWKGGELTRAELDMYRNRYFMTMEFLNRIAAIGSERRGSAYVQTAMQLLPTLPPNQYDQFQVDESVLFKRLLVEEAKRLGIVIGDNTIQDYLILVGNLREQDERFTDDELRKIAREATNGQMDWFRIRESLRDELAAQQANILRRTGMSTIMSPLGQRPVFHPNPTDGFQMFNRANTLVSAEVVAFPVADYLDKVTGSPAAAELKELYNRGKYNFPDPQRKIPGFKLDQRMNIQYFVADFNQFLEAEMAKVSDKELQEEYDRLVAAESPIVFEVIPEMEVPEAPALPGDTPVDSDAAPPPVTDEKQEKSKAENNSSGDGESASKDGDVVPPVSEGANKKDDGAQSGNDDGAAGNQGSGVEFVSFVDGRSPQDEQGQEGGGSQNPPSQDPPLQAPPKQEPPVQDPPLQDPSKQDPPSQQPPVENPPKQDPPAQDPPLQDPPVQEPPAEQKQQEVAPPAQQQAEQQQAVDQQGDAAKQSERPKPKKRQRPLKEVAEDVKRNLKGRAATEAMNRALEDASRNVREYQFKLYDASDAAFTAGKKFDQNTFPKYDGSEIAKKLGLQFAETGLFTKDDYRKTELGKMDALFTQQFRQVIPPLLFSQASYYEPSEPVLSGFGAKRVVFWFVEKHDAKVRTLEEAKDDVIAFWRHNLAFEAALRDAQKAAEEVSTTKKPLSERFGERAKLTGQFSWYSRDMRFGLSQPVGVESPGEEFMETVFSMKEGSVGVSHNQTKDIVYLIKIISTDRRTGDDMNREFITRVAEQQMFPMDVQVVSENYLMQLSEDFTNELIDDYKIEWLTN